MKTKVTKKEAADVLNQCLRRAFEATGLHHLSRQARWMKPGEDYNVHIPQFIVREETFGGGEAYEYASGISAQFEIGFGVGCDFRISAGVGESPLKEDVEVSWGSGGMNAPQAKLLIHQKALETATLYHAMRDDYWHTHRLVEPDQKVTA